MASRGAGVRRQPAAGPANRRPHTPRSHVFSGVPPPDLHTLNMQKTLEELRQHNTELSAKLDASQGEVTRLRQSLARQARGEQVTANSPAKGTTPPHSSPYPHDEAFQTHVAKLQELATHEPQQAPPGQSFAALTRFYEALEGRFSTGSAEAISAVAEVDALRARCHALEDQLLERHTADGTVEVQAARVVSSDPFPKKGGVGGVSAGPASPAASEVHTESAGSGSGGRGGSAQQSPSAAALGRSGTGSITFPRHRSGVSGSLAGAVHPTKAVPEEVYEKLRQIGKVTTQPACVAYVKKLKEVLKKSPLPEEESIGLQRAQTAKLSPFVRPASSARPVKHASVERSFSSGPQLKTLAASKAAQPTLRTRSRSPVNVTTNA